MTALLIQCSSMGQQPSFLDMLSNFIIEPLSNTKKYPGGKNIPNIYNVHFKYFSSTNHFLFSFLKFFIQLLQVWYCKSNIFFEKYILRLLKRVPVIFRMNCNPNIDIGKVVAWMNWCDLATKNAVFANKYY